jgi:[ribosomal protein S5]-alanine N-acetyltransferase
LIGGPFSQDEVQARLNSEIATMSEHGVQYWPILLIADDDFVGCAGLRPYKLEGKIYELGFHLRSAFWHKGLAEEAARAVIAYAFTQLRVNALFAGHHPANEASRHILQKLGFRYTHDELYPPTGLLNPSYFLTNSGT